MKSTQSNIRWQEGLNKKTPSTIPVDQTVNESKDNSSTSEHRTPIPVALAPRFRKKRALQVKASNPEAFSYLSDLFNLFCIKERPTPAAWAKPPHENYKQSTDITSICNITLEYSLVMGGAIIDFVFGTCLMWVCSLGSLFQCLTQIQVT